METLAAAPVREDQNMVNQRFGVTYDLEALGPPEIAVEPNPGIVPFGAKLMMRATGVEVIDDPQATTVTKGQSHKLTGTLVNKRTDTQQDPYTITDRNDT